MRAIAFFLAAAAFCSDTDDLARAYELQRRGSLRAARGIYEPLIARLSATGASPTLAGAMRRLGEVDLAEGKYPAAIQRASACSALSRKLELAAVEVDCLSLAARAQAASGAYQAALASQTQAWELARKNGSAEDRIAVLNNLGAIDFYLGRYGDAYRSYRDAEALLRGHETEAWYPRRRQLTLANLASLSQRLGQYQRALDFYGQLQGAPGAMLPAEKAQLLANMGSLYRRLGDPQKALDTYRQAGVLFATGKNLDGEIGVIKNSGIVLALDLDRLPEALAVFQRALDMATSSGNRREEVQSHLYLGETLRRLDRPAEARPHFEAALQTATAIGSAEDRWKALYGLGRFARALPAFESALAIIEGLRSGIGSSGLRTGFLADKRDVYDSAIELLLQDPKRPLAKILRTVEFAKARAFQDRVHASAALETVQARLDGSTVLLDYWIGPHNAALVWISKSEAGIVRMETPPGAELDAFAKELSAGGAGWRAKSATLGAQLLGPVRSRIASVKNVVIVPDGPLQRIPFETLAVSGEPGAPLLLETAAVSYLPSLSSLADGSKRARRSWDFPWSRELTAFADPRPGAAGGPDLVGGGNLALPMSAEEVRSIAAILDGRPELHSGADDLKRYLTGAPLRAPLLHLATHAIADPNDATRSRIVFTPESGGHGMDFLFTQEISALDLRAVRLATLAACDTEAGPLTAGEGVQSFSRAFLEAGAASVVTALWHVGDQSTAEFMRVFYGRLAAGEPAAEALRQTKLAFLQSGSVASQPRYWAAFVLNGNARTQAPFVVRWPLLLIAPILLVAAFGLWIQRARRRRIRIPG